MLDINDQHLLEGPGVTFTRAWDQGGELVPELVVVHFTAGGIAASSAKWLTKKDDVYVSAHVVIARDGAILQLVPFDRIAYHAGRSTWNGRGGCNGFALGIELANYGALERVGEAFHSWSGQTVASGNVSELLPHKNGGPAKYWERFPDVQVGRCAELVAAMLAKYPAVPRGVVGIEPVAGDVGLLGHDDISPGRKSDPGPAWNWAAFDIALRAAREDRGA